MLTYTKIGEGRVTKIECPLCGKRLPKVGLLPESRVDGLTFKCSKCGTFWKVKADFRKDTNVGAVESRPRQ